MCLHQTVLILSHSKNKAKQKMSRIRKSPNEISHGNSIQIKHKVVKYGIQKLTT